jgi:N-acetylneuraminate synthase
MDYAKKLGLICFSSPFDESAVDFLESLHVPCYKIASFENTDLDLVKRVAQTKKPMIISTGMASIDEIQACVETARTFGCQDLVLLKCTSTYPASPENTHLNTIPDMSAMFNCSVGLSDHTMGIGVSVAAIALGASVIEKHFTLNRADGGVDSQFSLEPHELKSLVIESERAWLSLGKINYGGTAAESKSKMFRRSLYFVKSMKAGDLITDDCIKSLRPNLGLALNQKESILGKSVIKDIPYGTPVSLDHIKDHGQ